MGGDCSIFYKQLPAFQEHYNLLLIDLPGHGQSASLNGEEPVEFGARKVTWVSVAYKPEKTYTQLAQRENTLPKLYVSGAQDHMFLPKVRDFVEKEALAKLVVIPACGHVCNIENAPRFNELAWAFLQRHSAPAVPSSEPHSLSA